MTPIDVYHKKEDGFVLVATVYSHLSSVEDALEEAWSTTQNVVDSWSRRESDDHMLIRTEPGARSTDVGDKLVFGCCHTYYVAPVGFKEEKA